jgi:nucleotide-binding universal stress UspA family protein
VGKRCLVAFDTDHIKQYVFATDKLAEIRGASSILDRLNRHDMARIAREEGFVAYPVYTNGGSGLFLLEGEQTEGERFGRSVQAAYRRQTEGGTSITFAVEEIPGDGSERLEQVWQANLWPTLQLLRYRLAEEKNIPRQPVIALPSHPFMRTCDACGSRYAEKLDASEAGDEVGRERRYCGVCMGKRDEDERIKGKEQEVKGWLTEMIEERNRTGTVTHHPARPFAWEGVLRRLPAAYTIPDKTQRPSDFDTIPGGMGQKDYLALIYADGNGMGQMMSDLPSLAEIEEKAGLVDTAVFEALSAAIAGHLPQPDPEKPVFPFDILLIGGDDMVIVTPAAAALDVACALARAFSKQTGLSLSVGVVLAPVKYPFGVVLDLAESTLKFAKKEGAKRQQARDDAEARDQPMVNFVVVAGSTAPDFEEVYKHLRQKDVQVGPRLATFYATRRPYAVEDMETLLEKIKQGRKKALGRTKLHQVREAVLKMNLSTSVYDGMAVLRNWRTDPREFVWREVYPLGNEDQAGQRPAPQEGRFAQVTFPWYPDGAHAYRTGLLDYVELYDFVPTREGDA